ncbi:MAG TPA: response regulator [Planctomycetota bacterium]|nr:response regulator [Planctomycetota bacterium]
MRVAIRTVLVVEDEPDFRRLLEQLLRQAGYRVSAVRNGRRALVRLRRGPRPCIILLDLRMPVMSGHELLSVLRDHPRHRMIPVVLMTSEGPDGQTQGAAGFIRKPFEAKQLLRTVARHCA